MSMYNEIWLLENNLTQEDIDRYRESLKKNMIEAKDKGAKYFIFYLEQFWMKLIIDILEYKSFKVEYITYQGMTHASIEVIL